MQSAKETASNVAASAKAGMQKTKATAQEKAEKLTTRDPLKKEMAEQKKDAAFNEAERMKHQTRAENAAARRENVHNYGHGYTGTGTGPTGHSTGTTDIPATTGGGTFAGEYPSATAGHTGTAGTGVQDPRVTGRKNTTTTTTGYGSGATR